MANKKASNWNFLASEPYPWRRLDGPTIDSAGKVAVASTKKARNPKPRYSTARINQHQFIEQHARLKNFGTAI